LPISGQFQPRHRIRLSIAGADHDHFETLPLPAVARRSRGRRSRFVHRVAGCRVSEHVTAQLASQRGRRRSGWGRSSSRRRHRRS
jgi:hypothetical protein